MLPVDDPFWNLHHLGDRWNCKCSLEQTDEPVTMPDDLEPKEVGIRTLLGVPDSKRIPDLKVRNGWVDVKSPINYRKITSNAIDATRQGAVACITDDRIEIDTRDLQRLSKRILENKDYLKNEVHFKIKGILYKYNSQGIIPG